MNAPALVLTIALVESRISQLDSVRVQVTLANHGAAAEVPSAYDISGALQLFVRGPEGAVRGASGITYQEMMVRGRVSTQPNLDLLEPGAEWSVLLDLGQSMYAPPPGAYVVVAELALPDATHRTSNEAALVVTEESVLGAEALRDNPILDGLWLLLERESAEHRFLMRQYNYAKPLGAWYGEPLPFERRPVAARPSYFTTESFDPFFVRWLLVQEGERVVARAFVNGKPEGAHVEAPLAAGQRLLASACDHGAGKLEVFAVEREAEIVALQLEPGALNPHFRVPLPEGREADPKVVGDRDGYWIAIARAGLAVARVDVQGNVGPWQQRFSTDLACHSFNIDPVAARITAAYWDGARGQHLQLIEADLATERVTLLYQERTADLATLDELAYDCDAHGTFHLLGNGPGGLFYQRQEGAPLRLASAGLRRAPLLTARPALHLGFYDPSRGYHFYAFKDGMLYRDPPLQLTEGA